MMDLLEIVKERPLADVPTDPVRCPACGGAEVRQHGKETTLIGWNRTGWDPNHTWERCTCPCGSEFVRETKGANVWYTADRAEGRVLRGMPSCFEGYTYSCAKCSGPVRRRYTALDGATVVHSLWWHGRERQFRIFYECRPCGHGGEVDVEYWHPRDGA